MLSSSVSIPLGRIWRETARGKSLVRISVAETLAWALRQHPHLRNAREVVELGYAPASHQRVYPPSWQVKGADRQPGKGVRYVFDINDEQWPLAKQSADIVLAMNTLYLARDPCAVLRRAMQVARRAVIWNGPFLAPYAPHPVDYHRFSYDWLRDFLPAEFQWHLYPYGGRASAAYALVEGALPVVVRLFSAPLVSLLDRWEAKRREGAVPNAPLGFLVVGLASSV